MTPPDKSPPYKPYKRPEMPFERKASSPLAQAGRWLGIGLEFGIAVALFFLGGWALDGYLGTSPWLGAVGAMFGVAVGMWLMVRPLLAMNRAESPAPTPSTGQKGAPADKGPGTPDGEE